MQSFRPTGKLGQRSLAESVDQQQKRAYATGQRIVTLIEVQPERALGR